LASTALPLGMERILRFMESGIISPRATVDS